MDENTRKMPGELGGAEVQVRFRGRRELGGYLGVDVPGVGVVYVPDEALRKVKPPLPPQPGVGRVVLAKMGGCSDDRPVVFERNQAGEWRSRSMIGTYLWEDLCGWEPPALLVPESSTVAVDPVTLPFSLSLERRQVRVDRRGVNVGLEISTNGPDLVATALRASLTTRQADEVARALLTAVAEAEGRCAR
jgi:hypothetical protein